VARVVTIDAFVRGGGTLICFNRSSNFAIDELKLPVINATAGLGRQEFAVNGSLLRVITDPTERVMAGMPPEAAVFYDNGPVFDVQDGANVRVLARFPSDGSALLSGFMLGEEHIVGKAAAVDVSHGSGHVVLLGFRPQWRGQPFGTFRVIFNAALFSGAGR
jgi:ribosomal protein S18 acetylase RimI-like enzyme